LHKGATKRDVGLVAKNKVPLMMGTNMLRYRFATIVMAIASLAGFAFSQAQSDSPCLVLAKERIRSGDRITLLDKNHQSLQGRLVGIDPTASSLTLTRWEATGLVQQAFESDQILQIKYLRPGKLRPLYPIVGFLVGSVVGQLAENYIVDPGYGYSLFDRNYTNRGSFWGGLSGAAIGIILSLVIPSTQVLTCP
jgi:hypothetical protein